MNKILIALIICNFALSSLSFAGWLGQNDYTHPADISFSSASISSVWGNVGDPIKATGYKRIAFPINFAINSASNVRFRVLWQETSGDTDYSYNRVAMSETSIVPIEPQYYEFAADTDAVSIIDFNILPVGYVQLQTQCGSEPTDKTLDGTLETVKYILLAE